AEEDPALAGLAPSVDDLGGAFGRRPRERIEHLRRLVLGRVGRQRMGVKAGVADNVRLDPAGKDGRRARTPAAELLTQRVREAAGGELGGGVGALVRPAQQPEYY